MIRTALASVALLPLFAVACGGGNQSSNPAPYPSGQVPPPGYGTAGYGQAPPGYPGAPPPGYGTAQPPPGYGTAQPPPGYGTAQPGPMPPGPQPMPPGPQPTPPAPSGASGTATPLDPTAAGAAGMALQAAGAMDAPGAGKEGNAIAGNFAEGQTLSAPITITPGKCYTFVAAGVGPTEMEIQLVASTPVPGLSPLMGDQKGTGGKVVLGKGSSCIKLALIPVPVSANWVIKATKGGGIIAGQAFSK